MLGKKVTVKAFITVTSGSEIHRAELLALEALDRTSTDFSTKAVSTNFPITCSAVFQNMFMKDNNNNTEDKADTLHFINEDKQLINI